MSNGVTLKRVDGSVYDKPIQPSEGVLKRLGEAAGRVMSEKANLGFALGVANAIGQGVTFGTADEAIAGLASLGGYDYNEVRDAIRENLEQFREDEPAFAYGAEIASSLLTPVGAAGLATKLGGQAIRSIARSAAQKVAANPLKSAAVGSGLYGAGAAPEISDVPFSAGTGALLGMGGQAMGPVVQKVPRALEKAGIPVTAGQLFGRGTKRMEEGMQSLPVIGTGIRKSRERAMEKFSPYIFNRALEPLGIKIPMSMTPRGAFNKAKSEFNKRYTKILEDVDIEVGDDFLSELGDAVGKSKTLLGEAQKKQAEDLENLVIRQVLGSAKDGRLSGESLKKIQSDLGKKRFNAIKANNFELADAYDEVDASLMNIFTRYSPSKQAELKKLDKAYSNYIPLRRAAAQADEAVITPARALQAVKAEERRGGATGLGRLAAGEARMQRPIEIAKRAIGAELPDSGTAERLGSMALPLFATTGVGALGGMATGSTELGTVGGLAAGLTGLMAGRGAYTPLGQAALKRVAIPAYSGVVRSPATAGLLAQSPSDMMQSLLLGE